jgi:hypothetical protein
MKNSILLPLLPSTSCYAAQLQDFKTGKFKFEYEVDGVKETAI